MITKKLLPVLFIAGAMAVAVPACKHKPSDADVQSKVAAALTQYSGVTAAVKDGVVTLNGNVTSADDKANIETAVNALTSAGVKSVVDSIQVTPPPPVALSPDDALTAAVKDATKDFPGITATVKDGVISVAGSIEANKWKTLKQSLDALHPKKVDAKGLNVK